jgi:hypothetical protein
MKRLLLFLLSFAFLSINQFAQSEPRNIVIGSKVTGNAICEAPQTIIEETLVPESSKFNMPKACVSKKDINANYVIELPKIETIKGMILQADWNDSYIVEFSSDGTTWYKTWVTGQKGYTEGIRTRSTSLPSAKEAKFIRIRGGSGDGVLSVATFQAYNEIPKNWRDLTLRSNPLEAFTWMPFLRIGVIEHFKLLLCIFALVVCTWWMIAPSFKTERLKKSFIFLAFASYFLWPNAMQFHYESFVHRHEFFHYYLGSKYSNEVSYDRLYKCAALADYQDGYLAKDKTREIRNLITNNMESSAIVRDNPSLCLSHFSAERWKSFLYDVTWFRHSMDSADYEKIFSDHGYNPTPVWTILGKTISSLSPISNTQVYAIGALDLVLLTLTWIIVFRTFGLEIAALCMVFWGCNYFAHFGWTGNGFLRSDWIVCSLLGICALKSNRQKLAGFLLVYAGLVRIFPLALLGGVTLHLILNCIKDKNFSSIKKYRSLLLSAIVSAIALIVIATANNSGIETWKDFSHNTKKHYETISTNMMGMRTVLSTSMSTFSKDLKDPLLSDIFDTWRSVVSQKFLERQWIYVLCCIVTFASICWLVTYSSAWEAAIIGFLLVGLIRLSNYDYYFLTFFGLLAGRSKKISLYLIIAAICSWQVPPIFGSEDKGYFVLSLIAMILLISIAVTLFTTLKEKRISNTNQ